MKEEIKPLKSYEDFVEIVNKLGFMPFSTNSIGFVSIGGDNALTNSEQWHTGLDDDPWQWRIKIEQEKKAAFGKLFDKKPGFISFEWYPYFLALRRKNRSFEMLYSEGLISNTAKQIYTLFKDNGQFATHEIKSLCGFTKDTNSKYESAMTELQMWMFITGNGTKRKTAATGEPYGWPSISYSTVETWSGPELIEQAASISYKEAQDKILSRIETIAPEASLNKMKRFAGII